jgi:alpha-beta hydrolase superfamily lysophospholipase
MRQTLSDSVLSTFTASDGDNLAVQEWGVPDDVRLRGVIVVVHGLGEHAGRYEKLAQRLVGWGFAVRGYDQYGHGESGGVRGALPIETRLIDDLADVIEATRTRMEPGLPLIVLGHSLGGLVASCLVGWRSAQVEGLVLSSPALDPGLNTFQKFLLATLPRIAPNLTVSNGIDANFISHDAAIVAAYKSDPNVHDRISGRLARFIADAGPRVVERASRWKKPTLLMYAGADKLVNPAGSRAFASAAPLGVVKAKCFEGLYHELFNEPPALSAPVFDTLKQWLDERF